MKNSENAAKAAKLEATKLEDEVMDAIVMDELESTPFDDEDEPQEPEMTERINLRRVVVGNKSYVVADTANKPLSEKVFAKVNIKLIEDKAGKYDYKFVATGITDDGQDFEGFFNYNDLPKAFEKMVALLESGAVDFVKHYISVKYDYNIGFDPAISRSYKTATTFKRDGDFLYHTVTAKTMRGIFNIEDEETYEDSKERRPNMATEALNKRKTEAVINIIDRYTKILENPTKHDKAMVDAAIAFIANL